ncbi:hypothetical protein IW261DRAFT_1424250 [Armillaria novae-zelandiae]|uniref:Uncharacterized protein n=1 Tax=Armillaria novae-zelandiae TaxID=153914 RepID=A0AA39NVX8_9AGAR|nr:hypothetical protein IW261DRAFT_1424250 [Armillaria novae-zelandiae]
MANAARTHSASVHDAHLISRLLLFTYILPLSSLVITVPTQPYLIVNASTSVLLTWGLDDPSQFWIVVRRTFSPDFNATSLIQKVENFTETRIVSLVFPSAGNTSIEAQTTSLTLAASLTTRSDSASATSLMAPSTSTAAPAQSSSKHNHTVAVVAAVIGSIILLCRNIERQGTFSTNFDDERQHTPSMPGFLNGINQREHRASPGSSSDHLFDVPPPPYSLFIRE